MTTFDRLKAAIVLLFIGCTAPCTAQDEFDAPADVTSESINLFNQGNDLSNSKKYSEAAEKFRAVCEQAPKFAEARSMYGFCLLRAGKLKEADEQLSKAFALDPKMPRTLMNLASAKESEGQLPAAIDLLEQFLKVYPNGEYAVKAKQRLEALKIEMTRREGEGGSVGKPDYFSEATAPGVARWADSYMPMKIFIAPASEVKSYKPAFANALREAFKQWVDASGGAISVRYVDAPSADGVTCSFIDDPHQISNPTEGGEARISFDSSGIIRKARLKICTQNSATGTPEEGDLVKNLCLHEVGHILGLTNHSSDNHDVMFGFRAYPANTKLSDRDKATIRKLYAQQSKAQQ